nr:hypothetical protein [Sphingomonas sp. Y57]
MKNAYVLEHHHGDDGVVSEGMILRDVAAKRFEALEKAGLVREATADEVKKGYAPSIEPDPSKEKGEGEKNAKEPANKKAADPANKGA